MKKITLIFSFLLLMTTSAIAQVSDGVYKLFWEYNSRGYLNYYAAEYPGEPQLAGVTLSGHETKHYTLDDAGNNLDWYWITSISGYSYLFSTASTVDNLLFLGFTSEISVGSYGAKGATLTATPFPFTLENASRSSNISDDYNLKLVSGATSYYLCSGCGSSKNEHPVRWVVGDNDDGVPFKFVTEGVTNSVSGEVLAAAKAKINEYEQANLKNDITIIVDTENGTCNKTGYFSSWTSNNNLLTLSTTVNNMQLSGTNIALNKGGGQNYTLSAATGYKLKECKFNYVKFGTNDAGIININGEQFTSSEESQLFNLTDIDSTYITFTIGGSSNLSGITTSNFEVTIEPIYKTEIEKHLALIEDKKGVVGYPVYAAMEAYSESINSAVTTADIDAAKATLYASTDINMPVDGEAYKIKYEINNGNHYYLYDNGSKIAINTTANTSLNDNSDIFIFRALGDGKYALTNNRGKYLVYYADGKTGAGSVSNGLADNYELGDKDAEITFLKASTINITNGSATIEQLFGGFAIQAWNANDNNMFYLMAKYSSANQFHNGSSTAFYYESELSSVFYLEPATYANTPKLNNVTDNSLINIEGSMATFSAPFPTIVPDGVTAYTATDKGDYVTLAALNGAIPANTGVILVGATDVGQIVMKPAATEAQATITENALGHSAGAEITLAENQCYLLGAANGVPGFYLNSAGTLAMNKAYLAISGQSNSVVIRVPGATGIESVDAENEEENIVYDLTGRRATSMTVPGIYIVNGKKVLVK